ADGFGHAEVDHLRHWLSVDESHQDVRRLEVAMDDALLMGVLHRLANGGEQFQPFADAELGIVAELGERQAVDKLHDEVRPATVAVSLRETSRRRKGLVSRSETATIP